jgi:hypothetical protein
MCEAIAAEYSHLPSDRPTIAPRKCSVAVEPRGRAAPARPRAMKEWLTRSVVAGYSRICRAALKRYWALGPGPRYSQTPSRGSMRLRCARSSAPSWAGLPRPATWRSRGVHTRVQQRSELSARASVTRLVRSRPAIAPSLGEDPWFGPATSEPVAPPTCECPWNAPCELALTSGDLMWIVHCVKAPGGGQCHGRAALGPRRGSSFRSRPSR